jgi:predicted nucleotidyltransferase
MKLSNIILSFSKIIRKEKFIKSARIYGSSLYSENVIDLDIAILIPSSCGVVSHSVYEDLYKTRRKLCKLFGVDIDLVPHTIDEIKDINSPLWHPRYNPSLVFGKDIKGKFPIQPFSFNKLSPKRSINPASFILHDTRTIARRQVIRSLKGEEARIFIAKLSHGPGNALTYLSFCRGQKYNLDPSNIRQAFEAFDARYGLDSKRVLSYIEDSKKILSKTENLPIKRALNILSWYELLVQAVLNHGSDELKRFLKKLRKIDISIARALWKNCQKKI